MVRLGADGRAEASIAEGGLPLVEIACFGFSSQLQFTRRFNRFVAFTPDEDRTGFSAMPARPRERPPDAKTLRWTAVRDGGVLSVGLRGRFDWTAARAFEAALRGMIEDTDRAAILDCGGLEFIGSAGLRVVLLTAKRLKDRDARLVLCALPDPVRAVFRVTGFERHLPIYRTRDAAHASLGG